MKFNEAIEQILNEDQNGTIDVDDALIIADWISDMKPAEKKKLQKAIDKLGKDAYHFNVNDNVDGMVNVLNMLSFREGLIDTMFEFGLDLGYDTFSGY